MVSKDFHILEIKLYKFYNNLFLLTIIKYWKLNKTL